MYDVVEIDETILKGANGRKVILEDYLPREPRGKAWSKKSYHTCNFKS